MEPIKSEFSDPDTSTTQRLNGQNRGLREFWFYFSENRGAVIGLYVFVALVAIAVFAPLIAPHDPILQNRDALLRPPVYMNGGSWDYILGTDALGRDLLSRLIYGARFSLFIGLVVVILASFTGVAVGLVAGYFRGAADVVIMRITDIILAFPPLLLALVMVIILGPGLVNVMIAIAIVLQPHFVRLTRASVLNELGREYVISARVAGASPIYLMTRTILPNCLGPIMVMATLSFSNAILDAAALGFLGMGAQPSTPEWGTMLGNTPDFIFYTPWVVIYPGLAILITVLAINLMGDGLRDALDPKLKRT